MTVRSRNEEIALGAALNGAGAAGATEGEVRPGRSPYFATGSYSIIPRMRFLWSRRKQLMRIALFGLTFSALYGFHIPNRYESVVRLMPPDNQSTSSVAMLAALSNANSNSNAGAIAGDLLGVKGAGSMFVGILQSRTVAERLIERFQLGIAYGSKLKQDAEKALAANTEIIEDKKSGIISIKVTDKDPTRAAAIAQGYVDELDHLVAQLNTSAAHRERMFLENRLESVRTELQSAEKDLGQFESKNATVDIKEQGKVMMQASATLEGELIASQSELEGLRQIYTENNIRVRSLQGRIHELQNHISQLSRGQTERGSTQTGKDEAEPEAFSPSLSRLPILGVTYADLYRRTKIEETIYEVLTRQYELAKVQEVRETPSVRVLDPANVPERKSFPSRLMFMEIGTICSLFLGMLFMLSRESWEGLAHDDARKIFLVELWSDLRNDLEQVWLLQKTRAVLSELRAGRYWKSPIRHSGEDVQAPRSRDEIVLYELDEAINPQMGPTSTTEKQMSESAK